MINNIQLRLDASESNRDILDVGEFLGNGQCGSAANAIEVMVRQSKLFRETVLKMRLAKVKEDAAAKAEAEGGKT